MLNGVYAGRESEKPFALFGDDLGTDLYGGLAPGKWTLEATPYQGDVPGSIVEVTFEIKKGFKPTPSPTVNADIRIYLWLVNTETQARVMEVTTEMPIAAASSKYSIEAVVVGMSEPMSMKFFLDSKRVSTDRSDGPYFLFGKENGLPRGDVDGLLTVGTQHKINARVIDGQGNQIANAIRFFTLVDPPQTIVLHLWNAASSKKIKRIDPDDVIPVDPSDEFTIKAIPKALKNKNDGIDVKRVDFYRNQEMISSQLTSPFFMFGKDDSGHLIPGLNVGRHYVQAFAYDDKDDLIEQRGLVFYMADDTPTDQPIAPTPIPTDKPIEEPPVAKIKGVKLYSAESINPAENAAIKKIGNGETVVTESTLFNIECLVKKAGLVDKVQFWIDDAFVVTEKHAPYFIYGDDGYKNPKQGNLGLGQHKLRCAALDGQENVIDDKTVQFLLEAPPGPTPEPTQAKPTLQPTDPMPTLQPTEEPPPTLGECGRGSKSSGSDYEITGELKQWHRISVTIDGPYVSEKDDYNPFANYRMTCKFTKNGQKMETAGFFAADGDAGNSGASSGNKWRCYFAPTETGRWDFQVDFRKGSGVALQYSSTAGDTLAPYNGISGNFFIDCSDKTGSRDFRGKGFLTRSKDHYYLRFQDGSFYLKNGADSPENFFGYNDFDDTYDTKTDKPPGQNSPTYFLHKYSSHFKDWNDGDPTWKNGKGKAIIGAVNYLASVGVNSIYMIPYNVDGGDGGDCWPWINHNERYRFDVSKLAQWEVVVNHMTEKGVMFHWVMQENENDRKIADNARLLYIREMLARFGHSPAMTVNMGEENNNKGWELKEISDWVRHIDPYGHPISLHTYFNVKNLSVMGYYEKVFDEDPRMMDMTSIQSWGNEVDIYVQQFRQRTSAYKWAVMLDEQVPPVNDFGTNKDKLRDIVWRCYLGGCAGAEWYFGYQEQLNDLRTENFRYADFLWSVNGFAHRFMTNDVQNFATMEPKKPGDANDCSKPWNSFCLYDTGKKYAIYFPDGTSNAQVDLRNTGGATFSIMWLNPRDGTKYNGGTISGGSWISLQAPSELYKDWAVLIQRA